jgi:hypothetical protein
VGNARLGQWEEEGHNGVYHVRRRLSDDERATFGVLTVRDIRGTEEERQRLATLVQHEPLAAFALPSISQRLPSPLSLLHTKRGRGT